MAAVRCPNCGAANRNGRRLLARCRRCHVYLAACRYCTYYDARLLDCTHPARPEELRIVDPSESLNCPDFTRGGAGGGRLRLAAALRALVLAAALVAVGLATGRITWPWGGATGETSLRATASTTGTGTMGAAFPVKVLVLNEGDVAAEGVRIYIAGRMLHHLVCESVDPPEVLLEATPRTVCASIGRLAPGQIASVTFRFVSEEPCQVKLLAQVVADNVSGVQRISIEGEILP